MPASSTLVSLGVATVAAPVIFVSVMLRRARNLALEPKEPRISCKEDLHRSFSRGVSSILPLESVRHHLKPRSLEFILESNRFGPFQPQICTKSSSDSLHGYWICKGPPGKSQLEVESDIVLVWFHGGGYCFGDPLSPAVSLLRVAEIAATHGVSMSIFSTEYTLAPAATFPRQQEEAVAVYRHLMETQAIAPDKIILAGDSAGGHLVLSCLLALHRAGIPRPRGALLMYPWVNLTNNSPTFESNRHKDVLSKRLLDRCVEAVIGERGRVEALNLEDLINPWEPGSEHAWNMILPPYTWINVGQHDVLLHDVKAFVERARHKGAKVHLEIMPNATHGWNFAVDQNAEEFFCNLRPDDQVPPGVMAGSESVCEGVLKILEDGSFSILNDGN